MGSPTASPEPESLQVFPCNNHCEYKERSDFSDQSSLKVTWHGGTADRTRFLTSTTFQYSTPECEVEIKRKKKLFPLQRNLREQPLSEELLLQSLKRKRCSFFSCCKVNTSNLQLSTAGKLILNHSCGFYRQWCPVQFCWGKNKWSVLTLSGNVYSSQILRTALDPNVDNCKPDALFILVLVYCIRN